MTVRMSTPEPQATTATIAARIAAELAAQPRQVQAAIDLLDGGATVPFVARYRKEATGGLDDTQLRTLEKRLAYLRELEARRAAVLRSIDEQGKLEDTLRRAILAAETHTALEDLYLPFRPKRRTRAQIARERGLEPLARLLLTRPTLVPEQAAQPFVDPAKGVDDVAIALDGAQQILIEGFAEDAALVGRLRERLWDKGLLVSKVIKGKETEGIKFSDYFTHEEPLRRAPSHRALALFRGEANDILRLHVALADDERLARGELGSCEQTIAQQARIRDQGRPADAWLVETVRQAWRTRLSVSIGKDLFKRLRQRAEEEAIRVFADNLRDLLLAAPAGARFTLGLDPGLRTGVKVAVVDATGKVLATDTIYPHAPQRRYDESIAVLARIAQQHGVELVSIGNGTASRETERLVADLIRRHPDLGLTKAMVSEAGASVYSASELAANELPGMDVSLRGAVSIARRLQDPLAELVKIEPRAIGVGQYQHDVDQGDLGRSLESVIEDCVNAVGVDVNTASAALLSRVSGLGPALAANVVAHREANGAFRERRALNKVARLGAKAFEQCAGFLRIVDGSNPLDASAVHPEAYPVVERILATSSRTLAQVIGDTAFLRAVRIADYTDARFGEPTIRDILAELEKPGRDPRPDFRTATFREGVESLGDLQPGMELEGVVTNVTNFGAFVDVGVHQAGLVHISQLADRFVQDPREVVKAGDVVRVRVVEVDPQRKRIGLTMRARA
jgi:uncharacterized protein